MVIKKEQLDHQNMKKKQRISKSLATNIISHKENGDQYHTASFNDNELSDEDMTDHDSSYKKKSIDMNIVTNSSTKQMFKQISKQNISQSENTNEQLSKYTKTSGKNTFTNNKKSEMTCKSFGQMANSNDNHLCVTVSKSTTMMVDHENGTNNSHMCHAIAVGFQVKNGLQKPLFWLKWSIVINLLKMMTSEWKHPEFDNTKQVCIRKYTGGQYARLVNQKGWAEYQMFVTMKSDIRQYLTTVVTTLVEDVKAFLTCPIFESMYMDEMQKENCRMHSCIVKEQRRNFTSFTSMNTVWFKELSLNDFLIDEDIKEELISIYGNDISPNDLDEDEKSFFFIDNDVSQFGTSDIHVGT